MKKRTSFNPKRCIRDTCDDIDLVTLARSVGYSGNPEHKRNPGDFGLTPPSQPRPDKTLCDIVRIMTKYEALNLLQDGVRKGMVSQRFCNGFPQNIWAVTNEGYPVEAQLENEGLGTYHGYPMSERAPFYGEVLARWVKDNK